MKIFPLGQLPEEIHAQVGGKAKGLDLLLKHHFPVPQGFVITAIDTLDEAAVYAAFDALNVPQVSVRSSASNEDQSNASNAGQYETCLFVDRAHLLESVQRCLDSLHAHRVKDYARHFDLGEGAMNIVVQEMVDSDKAGVLFTASPNNGSALLIEAVKGQGEQLVSGQVAASRYEISRKCYRPAGDALLSEDEVKQLYETGKKIRSTFGGEMDIEWAIKDGKLYLLQMRPITTEVIDIEEFDRDEDLSGHLFTKRNVGEMMPGAVTPLTLSTSAKAIDYGMRYMYWVSGAYDTIDEEKPLHMISSISGHLFFDMNLLYKVNAKVAIANPQSMNLSIMGEYHDYPPITEPYANAFVRTVNSYKFMKFVLTGHRAMKKFDTLLTQVHFVDGDKSARELYASIDGNIPLLNQSLIYHYAASAHSGSSTSTLYMMLDKYFPDKKVYQSFLSDLLSNIPHIESADILLRLQRMAQCIKQEAPEAAQFKADKLLQFIQTHPQVKEQYDAFLQHHGHRCIKEAEMRNKPWREDPLPLMNYLSSIISSPMNLSQGEEEIDYRQKFAFVKNPLLKAASITFARKARQAVVDREYTKSRLIEIIDLFKTQYARLAARLVAEGLLADTDQVYFLTHEELGELVGGSDTARLQALANRRRKAHAIQEELSFDDTYLGKPVANVYEEDTEEGILSGVPVSNGVCEGVVRIIHSADDANQLQEGEIMVARFTDIGWTPYYSVVKGLITEIGSSLSHGAMVAREYGLPTLVNVKGATKRLKNGDYIVMNANKGTITVTRDLTQSISEAKNTAIAS